MWKAAGEEVGAMTGKPYRTLDGSWVTELVRPERDGAGNLSVAEAVINPGQATLAHRHEASEEAYYVLEGVGLLWLSGRQVEMGPGDVQLIRPGEEHRMRCMSETPLRILCVCAPPYRHDDTIITERMPA